MEGIKVGMVRWGKLDATVQRGRVKPEQVVITDGEGRFKFSIAGDTKGIEAVVVFTCAEDRPNLIHKDVQFNSQIPRMRDLRRKKITRIDLTKGAATVDFALPSAPSLLRNVMMPVQDGTRLATDIFFPDGLGPWPVLLFRTPYNKIGNLPMNYLERGYAVVMQDFRGRFASEGANDMPFEPDGWGKLRDGYDAIEWIASQPWCNGKVGTCGGSALGITQVMTAGASPPHLKCQLIQVACGSMYHHAVYQGGAFRKALVEDWLSNNRFSPVCMETLLAHPCYDDYWRMMDAGTRSSEIDVPGLFIGGWYDVFCQGTIDAFVWRQYEGGEGARGKQKLIMGPWIHGVTRQIGEFTLPEHAIKIPPEGQGESWLDYWLKGVGSSVIKSLPVVYYVMGAFDEPDAPGHVWRRSEKWPVPCKPTPFYLHANGCLDAVPSSAESDASSYMYDPKNPVPTRGGCNLNIARGPFDQRPVENRPDVLLYTSEPLAEPLEVTGRIKAYLWASSSCRDTDFTVKLTDVYPDGRSVLLQDGIIRARYRESFEREELMEPGEIYRFEVDLWSSSIIFNKGHRIRVAVSSSNAPRFEPNPNTGDPFRANDKVIVAKNTIYHEAKHASHILLPVIP
ncbi:MAG: CocE/NonD family hydrolase [Planctomycetota bacterium]|nr:MAG: CocE/NonD family hydrolase [Planctomycetota bacterium]